MSSPVKAPDQAKPQAPPQGAAAPPPTPEEQVYLQACGEAIIQGAEAARNAAAAESSEQFLRLAQGVNQLAMALNAIKGHPTGHP